MPPLMPQNLRHQARILGLGVTWILLAALIATLEMAVDPLTAWERHLQVLFGFLIPVMALWIALGQYDRLANPSQIAAQASRHGANRQWKILGALPGLLAFALFLTAMGLLVGRQISHAATELLLGRDLAICVGIGSLATITYTACLLAATRVGLGRRGAWALFAADLTLGHVDAGWSVVFPHRHVANLIGYPSDWTGSARASSLILLGFAVAGLVLATTKTPR